jgi:hypothetical protein
MPRRCALTEAQLESLFALPADEADLIRHWTLVAADALQLCAFRYPGRLLRPDEPIPESLSERPYGRWFARAATRVA